jgi:hypothetical protein
MAEIAPDPPGWLTALRFDIDSEGGGAAWLEAELPPPNLVVVNPRNGHAHLIYLLGAWVQTDFGDRSRLKVIRYAAAIERAYTAALGADPGYASRFHHNPLSDTYVTKVGRDAPYSLAELARYVDLTEPPQKKSPPSGIGRNVEIFDRLRRWAYAAVVDWRVATGRAGGVYEAWCRAVADRAGQIAAGVGAASPRGPLKANEVDHIAKSVSRWVWERYGADVPPLLREARIAAQRERERSRQAAREAARERSRMTREEYVAPARQRRAQAQEMRAKRISVREIARTLAVSIREVYRLLECVVIKLVQPTEESSEPVVHGSPGLSDFGGGASPVVAAAFVGSAIEGDDEHDGVVVSEPSTAHGGAIAEAIVSEYAVGARSAQPESDVTDAGRGVRGETNAAESPIAYIQRRIREIVAKLREPEPPP